MFLNTISIKNPLSGMFKHREVMTESHRNAQEDNMVDLIDELDMFRALRQDLRIALRNRDTKLALERAEIHAVLGLIDTATNSANSPRLRYEAYKEILYMRGYKPVDKSAVLGINTDDMTGEEINARILSLLKDGESANRPKADQEPSSQQTRETSRAPTEEEKA